MTDDRKKLILAECACNGLYDRIKRLWRDMSENFCVTDVADDPEGFIASMNAIVRLVELWEAQGEEVDRLRKVTK